MFPVASINLTVVKVGSQYRRSTAASYKRLLIDFRNIVFITRSNASSKMLWVLIKRIKFIEKLRNLMFQDSGQKQQMQRKFTIESFNYFAPTTVCITILYSNIQIPSRYIHTTKHDKSHFYSSDLQYFLNSEVYLNMSYRMNTYRQIILISSNTERYGEPY